jgi:glycosyltransferase involved in cell wall biosynthesis
MEKKEKKIFMIYHGRFPAELGIAFFTAKMAESFSDFGARVTILAPRRLQRDRRTPSEYFGTKNNFQVVFLPVLDFLFIPFLQKISFLLSLITFSISSFIYLLFKAKKEDIIHSNEALSILLVSFFFKNTVYEIHDFPKSKRSIFNTLFKKVSKIIVTNRWKKEKIMQEFNLSESRILCEPNAVDFKLFSLDLTKSEARKRMNLPQDKFIFTYVGMLRTMGMEKGLSSLFSALKKLPEKFILVLVGGSTTDISYYKDLSEKEGISSRVIFVGHVKNSEVPIYLKASDVLVAPFPNNDHYNFYMSPMKIFEYMTSERPIVTTPLNSIQEVLGENSAIFVNPGDTEALGEAVARVEKNPGWGEEMALRARKEIEEHSWEKRAERILSFLFSKGLF